MANIFRVIFFSSTSDMPPDLIFFVTSRCNAHCDYCHFIKQIDDKARKAEELTLDEIDKIAKNYGKISKLSLSGGEPFIRKDIAEIVQAFIDHCGVGIVDIPTNGGFTASIIKQAKKILERNPFLVLELQLSIDGPEKIHDKVRNTPGLYRKMMQTYELLVQLREQYHNLRIKFNFVYQESNEDNIIDMTKEYDKNYTFDRFQLVYPHGPDFIKKKVDKLAYDKFYRLSVEMQKHMRFVRRSDIHSLVFRAIRFPRDEVMHKAVEEGDMGRRCHAGKRIVVLDDIGNVYPCEPLWHPVGNVRKTNYCIRAILNSKEMQEFKKKYLGPNKCNCTWGCTVLDSIIFNPIYYPKILYYMGYLTFFGGKGIQKSEVFNKKSRS